MTRQIINRGSFPGDASGEILYDAFGKVNSNSGELYALGETTRREGNVVYLLPSALGEYASAQEAIADVPSGGTLYICEEYSVDVHGAISLVVPIIIAGAGWGRESDLSWEGTKIINTTAAASITFNIASGNNINNYAIKDLLIEHSGAAYAIDLIDSSWGRISNVKIRLNSAGLGGIHYSNPTSTCFWNIIDKCRILNFTSRGIWYENTTGSKNVVTNSSVRSASGSAVAGIEISTKDTLIHNSQVDCVSAPSIKIVGTSSLVGGNRVNGIIIDGVISEEDNTLVQITRASGTLMVDQVLVRNPVFTLNHANRQFVEFDYAENCVLEMPIDYGASQPGMNLFTCTANSKNNLIKLSGRWGEYSYVDAGKNNRVQIEDSSDKQLVQANVNFPEGFATGVSFGAQGAVTRTAETSVDGVTGVWSGGTMKTPEDITSCVAWMDAAALPTLWQDTARSSQVTADDQSVLSWDDTRHASSSITFNNTQALTTITEAALTVLEVSGGEGIAVRVGDTVTVSDVTVNSGPTGINGTHTVDSVTDYNTFVIDFDSAGADYGNSGTVLVVENTPVYTADVVSTGVPGILFDGDIENLVSGAIALGDDKAASLLCVITPTNTAVDDINRSIVSRESGTSRLSVTRRAANPENLSMVGKLMASVTPGRDVVWDTEPLIMTITRDGATVDFNTNMSDTTDSETDDGANNAGEAKIWRIAANGYLDINTGTNRPFKGYIHSVAIFNDTLSESDREALEFYFMNRGKLEPVA